MQRLFRLVVCSCRLESAIQCQEEKDKAMKKQNRIVMFAGLVFVALVSLKIHAATPKKPEPQVWTPGCVASVPRSWGTFRGASTQSGLAFEDTAGTLRFLTNIPCDGSPVAALEIRRTAPNPNGGNQ
jgi:hypothetical protein